MTSSNEPQTSSAADAMGAIGSEGWLRERFPDKDWHRHPRTDGRSDLCDGTPADCASKPRVESPRPKMERDGILAVMAAGNRLSDAVTTFHELGRQDIAQALDDVLAALSTVAESIPKSLDASAHSPSYPGP